MKKTLFFTLLSVLISLSLSVPSLAQVSATGTVTDVHCHGDSTGSIAYQIKGGTGATSYVWNNGDSGTSVGGCTYTVHITNPGALLTGYQVQIPVTLASGMNPNFSNLQFTDTLGNVLPFWLQDFPTATVGTFWVRVPSLPTGTTDIYLTFCDTASVTGDPTGTFEFFDDFDHNTLPLWTQTCLSSMAGTTCTISADNTTFFSPGYSAHLQGGSTCFTPPYSGAGASISYTVNPIVNDSLELDYEDRSGATLYGFCSGGTSSGNSALDNGTSIGNAQGIGQGGSCASNYTGWVAEASKPFVVTTGTTTISLKEYGGDCDNSDGWFDDVRIRIYTSNPPTVVIDTTPTLYLNHLAGGTYVITMTNSGTVYTDTFIVTQPSAIAPVLDSINVGCYDSSTAVAWITPTLGGTPGYTFLWSNAKTTDTISGLTAGLYQVTVTDSYGCRDSASVNITQPSASVSAIADSVNVKCFGQNTGLAWVTASGGTPGYTYLWSSAAQATDTISGLTSGSYTVTVSDVNKCTVSVSVNVTQPATALSVGIATTAITCKGYSNGKLLATASDGTPGYTYLWNTGQTVDSLIGLSPGSDTITVTDANGCTVSDIGVIAPSTDAIFLDTTVTPASCGLPNGAITVTPSGGSGSYQYLWSDGAVTATLSALSGDSLYAVTVTDMNGCRDSASVYLSRALPLTIAVSTHSDSCDQQRGSASILVAGGLTPYTYTWSPANTDTAQLDSGIYSVTITDAVGCTITNTFIIENINNNCQPLVLFPTAFTPNGDGKNDVFHAIATLDLEAFQMRVYDRWGQLVFEAFDYTSVWDGTYKNIAQPIGTYVWFAQYNFKNKPTQTQSGNVTLIR